MSDIDNDEREQRFVEVVEAHLAHLDGEGPAPSLDELPADLRDEARERIALLDALWDSRDDRPDPDDDPDDDPVARRFGFDRAGQSIAINGAAVGRLRRSSGRNLEAFLAELNTAGAETTPHALFQLEQTQTVAVPQPLATAIVAVLDIDLADIETAPSGDGSGVQAFLNSHEFVELIASWAARHGRMLKTVELEVGRQLTSAQFRAEHVTPAQLRDAVLAILRSLER